MKDEIIIFLLQPSNWIPLSLIGFWTHQTLIWMKLDTIRRDCLSRIIRRINDGDEADDNDFDLLIRNNSYWLKMWIYGALSVILGRYFYILIFN